MISWTDTLSQGKQGSGWKQITSHIWPAVILDLCFVHSCRLCCHNTDALPKQELLQTWCMDKQIGPKSFQRLRILELGWREIKLGFIRRNWLFVFSFGFYEIISVCMRPGVVRIKFCWWIIMGFTVLFCFCSSAIVEHLVERIYELIT